MTSCSLCQLHGVTHRGFCDDIDDNEPESFIHAGSPIVESTTPATYWIESRFFPGNGRHKSGLELLMKNGERWFHPYDGSTPVQLARKGS